MTIPVELPQHVLDTRYLQDLSERIFPPDYNPPSTRKEREKEPLETLRSDLEWAAANRWCDCDPDQHGEEGSEEDSDDSDGWFCSYRTSIAEEFKIHVVLDRARSIMNLNPGDFSEPIHQEICERYSLEQAKVLEAEQERVSEDQTQISSPPSTPHLFLFPPFSLQNLPPEILVEIVLLAQAADPHAHITISHVNAYLRALVKSAPILWSRIDFLYPLHLVRLFLERSADVPIKVTMLPPLHHTVAYNDLLEDIIEDEKERMMRFTSAVWPHRHRIRSLRLRCDDLYVFISTEGRYLADFLWDGSMGRLELLDLELRCWSRFNPKEIPSKNNLRELHLHGPWTTRALPLFSAHVKSLVITNDGRQFTNILRGLKASPHLVSLTLRDLTSVVMSSALPSGLSLNHLESLSIIRSSTMAVTALLGCVTTPNLASLTIHFYDDWAGIDQIQLFPVPQRSVQQLDLTSWEGGRSFFTSVFHTFPCITNLRIASSNISRENLLPLAAQPSDDAESGIIGTACPKLKHLTIDNESNDITDVIRIIAFTRHNSGIPLESVTLRGIPIDDVVDNDIQRLGEIIPKLDIVGYDQDLDVYGDSDAESETSSEGDWVSGDEEIVTAHRKYGRRRPSGTVSAAIFAGPVGVSSSE